MQTFPPANRRAICHDHHYLASSPEDEFLKEQNISNISEGDREEIERATRTQAASKIWREERGKRLTASNFGMICKTTEKRDITKLLQHLLHPTEIHTKALAHGKKFEKIAISKFEELCDRKVADCGLFISASHPMLAASPDGIISDDILVEVKCPFSARNQEITETTVPFLERSPTGYQLKKQHNYYYQIQGQLYCANRKFCKLIVYTFKGLEIVDVEFDDNFVKSMTEALLQFYENHFKDAVLNKHLYNDEHMYDFTGC
jgi:hypothetical protein